MKAFLSQSPEILRSALISIVAIPLVLITALEFQLNIKKAEVKRGQGNEIISLENKENSDIQVLENQQIFSVHDHSPIPPSLMVVSATTCQVIKPESKISFTSEVNPAWQKACLKSLHKARSLLKSQYAPQTVSSILALLSRFLPPRPLQVKTTI